MKLSTLLPIVAVSSKKIDQQIETVNKIKLRRTWTTQLFDEEIVKECSDEFTRENSYFSTPSNGRSGTITAYNLQNVETCKHVIYVNHDCKKVKFNYSNVAFHGSFGAEACRYAGFWFDNAGNSTPIRCHCFNQGCSESNSEHYMYVDYDYSSYSPIFDWVSYGDFDHEFDSSETSDSLALTSNKFTFYYAQELYYAYRGSHIVVDWECVADTSTTDNASDPAPCTARGQRNGDCEKIEITKITEMANAVLDGSGANGFTAADGEDYGCAGNGSYEPFAKTLGRPVDAIDRAFYAWKKCFQCAEEVNSVEPYDYDKVNDSCGK